MKPPHTIPILSLFLHRNMADGGRHHDVLEHSNTEAYEATEAYEDSESELLFENYTYNDYAKMTVHAPYNFIMKITGLPWTFTKEQIEKLFNGMKVHVLAMEKDFKKRFQGNAFISFRNKLELETCLQYNLTHVSKHIKIASFSVSV